MQLIPSGALLLTALGFAVNERIGPLLIYAALAAWAPVLLLYNAGLARPLRQMGVVIWIVPVFCVLSTAWSAVPAATFRAGIELLAMIGMTVLTVRSLSPSAAITQIWFGLLAVVGLSVVFNQSFYDYGTGVVSSAGIFANKNSLAACSACLTLLSMTIVVEMDRSIIMRFAAGAATLLGFAMTIRARSVADAGALAVSGSFLAAFLVACRMPARFRRTFMDAAVVGGVAVAIVGGITAFLFRAELLQLVGKDPTLTGRTLLWFYAARFSEAHPLLGTGFVGFWVIGNPPAELLWHIGHVTGKTGFHFHSLMWQMVVDLGWIGFALGAFTVAYTIYRAFRWLREDLKPTSGFFLAFLVYVTIVETQGVDLFQVFSLLYFMFMLALGYSLTWPLWKSRFPARALVARSEKLSRPARIPA